MDSNSQEVVSIGRREYFFNKAKKELDEINEKLKNPKENFPNKENLKMAKATKKSLKNRLNLMLKQGSFSK